MNTWDAITARRNVRAYTDQAIPPADLDRVLEAGRRAPSANNMQRWDLVVCTDRAQLRELSKVWQGAGHVAGSAATIVQVAPRPDGERADASIQYDLGQQTMAIMIAAADLGIGSGHSAVQDQELARRILGFPEDRFAAWMVALGYPADRPLKPLTSHNRRPFDELVHRDRW